jgi:hypothetical protein
MFKDDYLIRIIEQLGDIMRKVLNLEENNNFNEAHNEIDKALKNLGLSGMLARTMPANELMRFAARAGEQNDNRYILLARLLSADAHIFKTEGRNSTAHELYKASLEILAEVSESADGEKLEQVQKNIDEVKYLITENSRDDDTMPGL